MRLSGDHIRLKFANAAGHAHRVRPITRRALELLRLRLRLRSVNQAIGMNKKPTASRITSCARTNRIRARCLRAVYYNASVRLADRRD